MASDLHDRRGGQGWRSCAPFLRVALDGSADHETMHDRRGKPSHGQAQKFNVLHFICETALAQDNDVVHKFTLDRSDQPFDNAILPG
jgi:hypothetical protein